jgi:hypothetical protein
MLFPEISDSTAMRKSRLTEIVGKASCHHCRGIKRDAHNLFSVLRRARSVKVAKQIGAVG